VQPNLLDYLMAEIAVVDPGGSIVHTNLKWRETARLGTLGPRDVPWNYVEECEAAARRGNIDAERILRGLNAVLKGDLSSFSATYACPFNRLHHWYEALISACEFDGKRHAITMHVDVSALQRDGLTGLPNRVMFDAQLDLALSLAREDDQPTGILIVDMDALKLINDRYGHRVGDQALIAIASEITKKVGPDAVAARIGGDEFGVVLQGCYNALSAKRMRAHFKLGFPCSIESFSKPLFISASVGMAHYPEDGMTASALLKAADESMYALKKGAAVA
jgi:diguanylate cyclase (GGDEF)-like protein